MVAALAGDQWNEGDVSCSVVRRVALPDAFFAVDGLFETLLHVLDEFGAYPAVIERELRRYLPFLATTKVLMAAVRAGVGRETAHEVIKEHAVAVALEMREKGTDANDLLDRLAADGRLGLVRRRARAVCWPSRSTSSGRRRARSQRSSPRWPQSRPSTPTPRATKSNRCCEAARKEASMSVADLTPMYSGKVRDIYDAGDGHLLMVTSDRMSAFDVVMAEPVPDKGRVLTAMSAFWFEQFDGVVGSHLVSTALHGLPEAAQKPEWAGRVMLCRRAEMLPIECIVRGYITGSAWKEYRADGTMHGERLPEGLLESSQLPEPVFTPSTKAEDGDHDMNISFEQAAELVGPDIAARARDVSLELYTAGRGVGRGAGDHHRRHQVRARVRRRRAGRSPTRSSPRTPRGSGRPTSGSRARPRRRSTSSRCGTTSTRSTGTRNRHHRRLPTEVVDATRTRYVEAYERVTGRSFADWHG